MNIALMEAKKAAKKNEVPVGCVIVRNGKVIAAGRNARERRGDPLAHAEIVAIKRASKRTRGWRLETSTLYVTLEPCPMCAGAIINARIKRVVFGTVDPKAGCFGTLFDFKDGFNHHPEVTSGILREKCSQILKDFFADKRK